MQRKIKTSCPEEGGFAGPTRKNKLQKKLRLFAIFLNVHNIQFSYKVPGGEKFCFSFLRISLIMPDKLPLRCIIFHIWRQY